jgi:Uma2 family endonuclease
MATEIKVDAQVGEERFVLWDAGWEIYEKLLERYADGGPRMNYLRGSIEFMSPLIPHARFGKLFGYMVEAITDELDIPRNALGNTTFKRKLAACGLEPDECYYLANAGRIPPDRRSPDLDVDPPPDLAIEIEITNSILDKLDIYAGIGVPEIWRYDGEILSVLLLQADGTYALSETSRAFPFLPMSEVVRFLEEYDSANETRWGRSFRAWVREVLLPLYRGDVEPA